MNPPSTWHTIANTEQGCARVELNSGRAFLHLTLTDPIGGALEARRQLPKLKATLRNGGFKYVHVIIPEGDNKLYRFERAFGFTEVKRFGGQILMRQEC